jgi:hypothetical protein
MLVNPEWIDFNLDSINDVQRKRGICVDQVWIIGLQELPVLRRYLPANNRNDRKEPPSDFGILKWPTSAVCFGPPLGPNEPLVWTEHLLCLEAGVGLESQGGAIRADSPGV